MFVLDPQLKLDTFLIGQAELCDILLMNDARYPWLILVPRREAVTEIYQLTDEDQQRLSKESAFVAQALMGMVSADKMNIAALGNVVSQLHIHHVARYQGDDAWPAPVWGKGERLQYTKQEASIMITEMHSVLKPIIK